MPLTAEQPSVKAAGPKSYARRIDRKLCLITFYFNLISVETFSLGVFFHAALHASLTHTNIHTRAPGCPNGTPRATDSSVLCPSGAVHLRCALKHSHNQGAPRTSTTTRAVPSSSNAEPAAPAGGEWLGGAHGPWSATALGTGQRSTQGSPCLYTTPLVLWQPPVTLMGLLWLPMSKSEVSCRLSASPTFTCTSCNTNRLEARKSLDRP